MTSRRRAAPPLALLVLLGGCAYFNGIYNAKQSAKTAEGRTRQGRESEAAAAWALTAARAETVLARFPRTRWRDDALFLAGRGHAFSGACPRAIARLSEFLERHAGDGERHLRARIALGSCLVREGRPGEAIAMLEPLSRDARPAIARDAALWAGRAALALGDATRARALLAIVGTGQVQWELGDAALSDGRYAEAESLLALRAMHGDFREEVLPALDELWRSGRRDAVDTIVARYDRSRLAGRDKARLLLQSADRAIAAGRDSAARAALIRARRLVADTLVDREASARLVLLSLATLDDRRDVVTVVEEARPRAGGSALYQRLQRALLLLAILEAEVDPAGASLFLAAEVARDSLRAPRLAVAYLRRVSETAASPFLIPKALLTIGTIRPDTADAMRRAVLERYPGSPWAMLVEGGDLGESSAWTAADRLLAQQWDRATKALGDTLAQRERERAGVTGTAPPPPPS